MPAFSSPVLLQAVDRLTKPRRHREVQALLELREVKPPGDGLPKLGVVEFEYVQVGRQVRTLTEPSLFEQLAGAAASSLGGSAGGATLPHERLIFNSAVFALWQQVCSSVGVWRASDFNLGTPPLSDPALLAHALRDWYSWLVRTNGAGFDEDTLQARADKLNEWARAVHSTLNPKREQVLPNTACPECGEVDYWSEGSLYPHPLVVRFTVGAADLVETATGHCRACGTDWNARALAWDLEQVRLQQQGLTQTVAEAVGSAGLAQQPTLVV